jgi:hypothetical protein
MLALSMDGWQALVSTVQPMAPTRCDGSLRELTNKIIHAKDLSWDLSNEHAPKLICTASDDQKDKFKWIRAEVDIVNLAFFCDAFVPDRI